MGESYSQNSQNAETRAFEIAKNFVLHLVEKKYQVDQAFVFGSYANGNFSEDSDIDLAIVLKEMSDSVDTQMELMKLSWRFDSRLEPHPFDQSEFTVEHPLASEIIKTGIRI